MRSPERVLNEVALSLHERQNQTGNEMKGLVLLRGESVYIYTYLLLLSILISLISLQVESDPLTSTIHKLVEHIDEGNQPYKNSFEGRLRLP